MPRTARLLLTALLALTAIALPVVAATAPTPTPVAVASCDTSPWGSVPEAADPLGPAPVTAIKTGRHDCYDRVVFHVAGPAAGYRVEYVDQVVQDGSGAVVPVPGGARLRVAVHHPANSDGTPTIVPPPTAGQPVADVTGYDTLQSVVYAGSFEGVTTTGVGVRALLPFRVTTIPGPGTSSRIVVDVAHAWA